MKARGEAVGFIAFLEENKLMSCPGWARSPFTALIIARGWGPKRFHCLINYFREAYHWPILRAGLLEVNSAALAFARHLGFQPVEEGLKQFLGGEQRFIVFAWALAEA